MSRKVFFDIKCDQCENVVQNHYEEGGLGQYGSCDKCKSGVFRQMLASFSFSLKTPIDTVHGRTTNGTSWNVGSKPKSYNPATGTYK